jgi:hypothetical protein
MMALQTGAVGFTFVIPAQAGIQIATYQGQAMVATSGVAAGFPPARE